MYYNQDAGSLKKSSSSQLIIDAIRWNYPISRVDIANQTKLSLASVSRVVNRLLEENFIEEVSPGSDSSGMGRKALLLRLKENQMFTAGAEYDGEILKLAIINEIGKPLKTKELYLPLGTMTPQETASEIYEHICRLIQDCGRSLKQLFGIGIGFPGIINYIDGKIIFSSQLGWENINFKQIMEDISGKYCMIENDLKANIYGEYIYGAAKGSDTAIIISFGSGIGSAVIIDGRIMRGATNSAGEIGHITQDVNGSICKCGKLGCLQTNIAKSFLLDEAKKVSNVKSLEGFMNEVSKNQPWAKRLCEKLVNHAAIALDTAVCVYNPDTVIICGELVDEFPYIYNEICRVFLNHYLWDYFRDTFKIYHSTYKGLGCAIGVGALVQDKYFYIP